MEKWLTVGGRDAPPTVSRFHCSRSQRFHCSQDLTLQTLRRPSPNRAARRGGEPLSAAGLARLAERFIYDEQTHEA
jgi:hypothetical protein